MDQQRNRAVGIWLLIGVGMILIQIALGGITRLTESGLSITEWNVVSGTLPPMNHEQWVKEFDLYKASPQYQKVNEGMSLSEFKFIFFWEWFHRLWARLLGFVFLIPFVYFIATKKIRGPLVRKALTSFVLGGIVGLFGWLMVASGLQDRPLVSPYRLALHLSLAVITMLFLYWVALGILVPRDEIASQSNSVRRWTRVMIVLVSIQIILGALVSGMRAAPYFPTWPDMNGTYMPVVLRDLSNYSWNSLINFDKGPLAAALMQFLHRNVAYLIVVIAAIFVISTFKQPLQSTTRSAFLVFASLLVTQVLLGIFTLLGAIGSTPVGLGVLHQGVAMLILLSLFFILHRVRASEPKN